MLSGDVVAHIIEFDRHIPPLRQTDPIGSATYQRQPAPASPGGVNFEYTRNANLGTATLVAKISTVLTNWHSGSDHIEAVSDTAIPYSHRRLHHCGAYFLPSQGGTTNEPGPENPCFTSAYSSTSNSNLFPGAQILRLFQLELIYP